LNNNTNLTATHFNSEALAKLLLANIQLDNELAQQNCSPANATTQSRRESFPNLISFKEAQHIGITRNNFYIIAKKHPDLVVKIQARIYLNRDKLFDWIDNGGDRKAVA
jgi:hypothetical protein